MRIVILSGVMAATLLACGYVAAQANPQPAAAAASSPDVEPMATDALVRMSRYLQTLHAFEVHATTSTDQVLTDGEKVQLDASIAMWVRRPDHLRVDVTSDRKARQFYYDGKTVTIFGVRSGYYAKAPAPPTLKALAARLSDDYDVDLPLADLFTWSDDPSQLARLTSAAAIGLATIRGAACDQYAFREDGLDWQLWVQRGAQPLPRRLVLTTTSDASRPTHSIDLDWSPSKTPAASVFAFVPPAGAHEIPLRRVDSSASPGNP